jgi:uncharacterized Zn finger protein
MASGTDGTPTVVRLGGALENALRHDDAHQEPDWASLDRTVRAVQKLARSHPTPDVVALAERGIAALVANRATDRRRLTDLADRLLAAHAVACRASGIDPDHLAEWLVRLQLDHPDGPQVRVADYAAALGDTGLVAYRDAVEALCDALPTIGFGEVHREDRHRWAVRRLVQDLVDHTADVDLQVKLLATDLSSGWHYLRVAGVLQEAGRVEQALEWVRRGLRVTSTGPAALRLVDLAVDECLQLGWFDQARELRERAFRENPDLSTYLRLRVLAWQGAEWPARREALLRPLHERAADDVRQSTALVRILLWEGEKEAAWRVAQQHGCADEAWWALADERAERHPADAIEVYRDLVEQELEDDTEDGGRVADLLEQMRGVFTRTGRPDAFSRYLDGIKSRHVDDRRLLDELARRGL